MKKKSWKRSITAGMIVLALVLGACGQPGVPSESEQEFGISIAGAEGPEGGTENVGDPGTGSSYVLETVQSPAGSTSADVPGAGNEGQGGSTSADVPGAGNEGQAGSTSADVPGAGNEGQAGSTSADVSGTGNEGQGGGILQPTYIGSWKVTEYCYPSTPCGLSQLEVDVLIGSELIYTSENFSCNQRVVENDGFGYEFSFYDSLAEFEQDYKVSVNNWFEEGDTGLVKSGFLTIEEGIFGDSFSYMEEQPDKMLICYYGVVFLAVREQTSTVPATQSSRDNAYREALNNLLYYNQLPLGQDSDISHTVYFAIQDIDGDGREELLINYEGTMMAATQEMVYDYDENKGVLYREIWDFPEIMFYGNGYARSDMSHNHTWSEFWPYNLYRYNDGTDQYELAYVVTAWDKALVKADTDGNPFPDAVDVSGTGRVFMIEDSTAGQVLGPMDTADYEKWYSDMLGEYAQNNTVVVWQLLAEENLRNPG